jgi:outer membrane immunogenic protein
MRRLGLALLASIVLVGSAGAADLPAKAPVYKAPVYVAPFWTGFYAGLNLGYSWGRSSSTVTLTDAALGTFVASASGTNNLNGIIGGGQVGYNYQIQNWVLGIETDIQWSGQKGSSDIVCVGCGDGPSNITTNLNQKLNWFGTLRGRGGILITPTILAYVTGGLAYGGIKTDGTVTGPTIQGPLATATFSDSSTKTGWVLGGGIEGIVSGNWTAKLEYLYIDFGTVSGGPFATTIIDTVRRPVAVSYSSHITDNIVRVGLNYKF